MTGPTAPRTTSPPPRRLDQLRLTARQQGHAEASVATRADGSLRFILFHGQRHLRARGWTAIGPFLESVAHTEKDPVPALSATREALDFLDREVLHLDLGELPLPRPPRLLDQVHQVRRVRPDALRSEACDVPWITRFILFHHQRHPRDRGAAEGEQFLTHLGVDGHVSASTPNQALNALVFLYRQVLDIDLGRFDAVRARRPNRRPEVLAPAEVAAVLERVDGGAGVFRLSGIGRDWGIVVFGRMPRCLRFLWAPLGHETARLVLPTEGGEGPAGHRRCERFRRGRRSVSLRFISPCAIHCTEG